MPATAMQIQPQLHPIFPEAWFEYKFAWTSILNTYKLSSTFRASTCAVQRCDFACRRFVCTFSYWCRHFHSSILWIMILYTNLTYCDLVFKHKWMKTLIAPFSVVNLKPLSINHNTSMCETLLLPVYTITVSTTFKSKNIQLKH